MMSSPGLMPLEVSGERAPSMLRGLLVPLTDRRPNIQTPWVPKPQPDRRKMIMERLLLSPDEVAESLGVCRSRVYDLMRTRLLPSVKIGRARRVPVRAYVDQLTDSWDLP
jgi:excisionase family DNA binding protein